MTTDKPSWTEGGEDPAELAGAVGRLTTADLGVVFQPIVEVSTGSTFAHEAFVRCKRPEYSSPPLLFERAAEEGACGRLGRLIREVAFSTSGDVPLFVNLHPEELNSRWLERRDDPLCFHARPVFLEINESAAFTHFDLCHDVLNELCHRTGALLAVDDFGAAYSNLQRIVDLRPAVVKLDLALTRDVHRQRRKQAVVRHLINLCDELEARVVAEGVETVEELACMRDLGAHYAQGYLFARPAAPPPGVAWPFGASVHSVPPARPVLRRGGPSPLPPRKHPRPKPSKRPTARSTAPPGNALSQHLKKGKPQTH